MFSYNKNRQYTYDQCNPLSKELATLYFIFYFSNFNYDLEGKHKVSALSGETFGVTVIDSRNSKTIKMYSIYYLIQNSQAVK